MMIHTTTRWAVAWLLLILASAAHGVERPASELLSPPKTYAFLGDSITHNGKYHSYFQLFLATRHPGAELWTVNVGWSGDTSWGGLNRWQWDLPDNPRPDVVFIHFGMNDVDRDWFKRNTDPPSDAQRQDRRDRYTNAMRSLIGQLKEKGMKVVVLSPTIFDDTLDRWDSKGERPHLDEELRRFGEMARALAEEVGAMFIDLHAPMLAINQREQAKDAAFSLTIDRVHPRRGGEEVMLVTILEALGASATVYDMTIDAGTGKAEKSVNAQAEAFESADGGLRFALIENALPFPTGDGRGFELADFNQRFNRQRLAVTNLQSGRYELWIDDTPVGTYSADELAVGIELATNEKTPQYQTAKKLRDLIVERKYELERQVRAMAAVVKEDWRTVDPAQAIAAIDKEINERTATSRYSGWTRYILPAARKATENRQAILDELSDIRRQLQAVPKQATHQYRVLPVKEQ